MALTVVALAPALAALAGGGTDAPTPEESQRRAAEILSRTEFQQPEPNVLERAGNWIRDVLQHFLQSLTGSGPGSAVAWFVLVALVLGVVLIILRVSRTLRHEPSVPASPVVESRRSSTDWRTEAERFEAAGDWKEALRCHYRALVTKLVERDLLDDIPGRTTGEYRHEVDERAPAVAPAFGEASGLFERAWYGDEPTGPDENMSFRALSDRVLEGARR